MPARFAPAFSTKRLQKQLWITGYYRFVPLASLPVKALAVKSKGCLFLDKMRYEIIGKRTKN
jgi:hypothetical protein